MAEAARRAGELEDRDVAHEVGAHVDEGVFQRIAHPGLGGEVDDAIDARVPGHRRPQRLMVGNIEAVKSEAGFAREPREPRLLQPDVVIVVHIIHADDSFAARQQRLGDVIADEPGGAGDEDCHGE